MTKEKTTMYSIKIDKSGQIPSYFPGEEVKGRIKVDSDARPSSKVKVNLVWQTRGKGTVDTKIVASQEFDPNNLLDGGRFALKIPALGPYSVSGRLLSISWRVEIEKGKSKNSPAAVPITISATGNEVILHEVVREVDIRPSIRSK